MSTIHCDLISYTMDYRASTDLMKTFHIFFVGRKRRNKSTHLLVNSNTFCLTIFGWYFSRHIILQTFALQRNYIKGNCHLKETKHFFFVKLNVETNAEHIGNLKCLFVLIFIFYSLCLQRKNSLQRKIERKKNIFFNTKLRRIT